MKRFTQGFLRNFVVLLALIGGVRAWQSGHYLFAGFSLAILVALVIWQIRQYRNRNSNQ